MLGGFRSNLRNLIRITSMKATSIEIREEEFHSIFRRWFIRKMIIIEEYYFAGNVVRLQKLANRCFKDFARDRNCC